MLLSANPPLDLQAINKFYFRRLKRILPLYLSIILFGFVGAWIFMSPTDFEFMHNGATRLLAFIANWPTDVASDYFAKVRKFTYK
jgi:peptidoglycan/LPS O-acetylase OafA/YrhL